MGVWDFWLHRNRGWHLILSLCFGHRSIVSLELLIDAVISVAIFTI